MEFEGFVGFSLVAVAWGFIVLIPILIAMGTIRKSCADKIEETRRQFESRLRELRLEMHALGRDNAAPSKSNQQSSGVESLQASAPTSTSVVEPARLEETPRETTTARPQVSSEPFAEKEPKDEEKPTSTISSTATQTESSDARDVLPPLSLDSQAPQKEGQEELETVDLDAFLDSSPDDGNAILPPISIDRPSESATSLASDKDFKIVELDEFVRTSTSSTPNAQTSPRPASNESAIPKSSENESRSFQDALEMLVGRKLLAWVAVLLFVVGSAFFVQVAIEKGLLNPTNRCVGLILLGSTFLFFGRRLHKRGMRRYAETLTSSGVVTFILTGYYAMRAQVAPFEVDVAIMITSVFGGFIIAGLYRSTVVGLTASLGGLATPFLIERGMEPSWLTIYLLAFFGSAIVLVNWLRRSSIALVPWVGALFVFFAQSDSYPHNADSFNAMLSFLAGFYALDLLDQLGLFLTRRREGLAIDLLRVLLSPIIVTLAFWQMCLENEHNGVLLGELTTGDFLDAYGKYIALSFFALYAILAFVAKPRMLMLMTTAPIEPDSVEQLKFAQAMKNVMNLRSVFAVLAFLFFTVAVSMFMTTERVEAVGWSALAVGALLIAGHNRARLRTPAFVLTLPPGAQRERLAASYLNSERRVVGIMTFWSALFFAFAVFWGVALLNHYRFFSLEAFVEVVTPNEEVRYLEAYPFVNPIASPTLIASLILLGASLVHTRLFGAARNGDGSPAVTTNLLSVIYTIVGAVVLLFVAASEIYAYVTSVACKMGYPTPGLVGCAAVLIVWAAIAFLLYLFGAITDAPKVRLAARVTTGFLLAKLILINLIKHPLLGGGSVVPLLLPPSRMNGLPDWVDCRVADELSRPLLNAYSLPFVIVAALMILFGIVARYARSESYRANYVSEQKNSAAWGALGFMLLVGISSLDCFAWFHFRPERFGANDFYAWRSIWMLLLAFAYVVWELGRALRSDLSRTSAYALLILDLFLVAVGEFFSLSWRVNDEKITELLNPYAAFAAIYFVSIMILGARRGQIRAASEEPRALGLIENERKFVAGLGVFGLAGLVALASFETYRYFTGVVWFGSADCARLIALSILWTFGIAIFLAIGRAKSQVGAWFAGILMLLLFAKYFAFDISLLRGFRIPFFNPFTLATFIVFGALLYAAYAVGKFTSRRLEESRTFGYGKRLERVNASTALTSFIVAVALFQALIGTSVDVWRCADFFPRGEETPIAFMAQTALSVLWTVFATVLLVIGFILNKRMLRWFAIMLYGLTTFKVLTVDLSYLESIYRVVAIFALAFALMLAAYWYNRRRAGASKNGGAE